MFSYIIRFLESRSRRLIALVVAILLVSSTLLLLLLQSGDFRERLKNRTEPQTLETIFQKGKLIAICETSTISYFKNKRIAMGYEYDILKNIAKSLGLTLEVLQFDDPLKMNKALLENRGHLIADFRVIGNKSPEHFIYSHPHTMSVIALVQRKEKKSKSKVSDFVEDIYDLDGKTIHVQTNSIAHKKLIYFADEYALDLKIIATDISREDLISKVSKGEIDFTVIEREIIAANKQLFSNLDYSLNMSFPYRVAFTFRGDSEPLRDTINAVLDSFMMTDTYKKLVFKYIENDQKNFHRKVSLLLLNGAQISKLDTKLKQEALKIDWDWRLLASIIMKESRFSAYATNSQGSYGLMQFMPRTGVKYGVYPNSTPEVQIEGGVKYLEYLQGLYPSIKDLEERPKFVLASYNAGPAHIFDARRLAKYFKEDENNWEVVSKYLLQLNNPEIYKLECVRHGAYNGQAVVNYVKGIYKIYADFQAYAE